MDRRSHSRGQCLYLAYLVVQQREAHSNTVPEQLTANNNQFSDKDPSLPNVTPLFFTVDPVRDTPDKMKKYCQGTLRSYGQFQFITFILASFLEYSPKLLGLGGTMEQVKGVCKKFRVYFGLGPKDPEGDYIVCWTEFLVSPYQDRTVSGRPYRCDLRCQS